MIRDLTLHGRSARVLMQDLSVSGGRYLDDGSMAFDYTKYYGLYRLFVPELRAALAIGGGTYSVPGAILRDSPRAVVDVAEIDPTLHALARRYFALPDDARLRNHVTDGRRFLHDTGERYDLIFSDAFGSLISAPPQFSTLEFFLLARAAPGGRRADRQLLRQPRAGLAGGDLRGAADHARRFPAGLCARDGKPAERGAAELHLHRAQRRGSGPARAT